MAEDLGRLLATSIAQLEQRLSAQIGDGFEEVNKKMNKIEERVATMEKKVEIIEERMDKVDIAKNETTTSSGKEDSVWSEDEEEESRLESNISRSIVSNDGVTGWSLDFDSDYDEDEPRTAIEPGKPRWERSSLFWKDGDEFIKKMQAERMSKDGEIPSFWNYDPCCLAKEFIGSDKKTFLVDPLALNICFLDKDILRKISKMLIPMDFLNLSYTCRYLHWRLFTFCTCYVSYEANVDVRDLKVNYYYKRGEKVAQMYEATSTKTVYSLSLEENARQLPLLAKQEGLRAVVAHIPSWLRRPFFFDRLRINIDLPFCTKDDFDRCLVFVQPLRKYARQMDISLGYCNLSNSDRYFDYEAVNNFLKAINATSVYASDQIRRRAHDNSRTMKLYDNCPYVRLMDSLSLYLRDSGSKYEDTVFLNRTGYYQDPPVSAIIRTIKEFCFGSANLDYHRYELTQAYKQRAFHKYFSANYDQFEEYYNEYEITRWGGGYNGNRLTVSRTAKFVTIMKKETGEKLMMKVLVEPSFDELKTCVTIGKEKIFTAELKKSYSADLETCRTSKDWRRMGIVEGNKEEKAAGGNPG